MVDRLYDDIRPPLQGNGTYANSSSCSTLNNNNNNEVVGSSNGLEGLLYQNDTARLLSMLTSNTDLSSIQYGGRNSGFNTASRNDAVIPVLANELLIQRHRNDDNPNSMSSMNSYLQAAILADMKRSVDQYDTGVISLTSANLLNAALSLRNSTTTQNDQQDNDKISLLNHHHHHHHNNLDVQRVLQNHQVLSSIVPEKRPLEYEGLSKSSVDDIHVAKKSRLGEANAANFTSKTVIGSTEIIIPMSASARKASFPVPTARGRTGRVFNPLRILASSSSSKAASKSTLKRSWDKLHEMTEESKHMNDKSFVKDLFLRSLHKSSLNHLQKSIGQKQNQRSSSTSEKNKKIARYSK